MEADIELIALSSVSPTGADSGSTSGHEVPVSDGVVTTPVTLLNANAMSAAGDAFIAASKTVQVQLDMAKVEPSSVAVAVTLAWLASAQRHGKELCLGNLRDDFSGVIEFSGISSMFAEHTNTTPQAAKRNSPRD